MNDLRVEGHSLPLSNLQFNMNTNHPFSILASSWLPGFLGSGGASASFQKSQVLIHLFKFHTLDVDSFCLSIIESEGDASVDSDEGSLHTDCSW